MFYANLCAVVNSGTYSTGPVGGAEPSTSKSRKTLLNEEEQGVVVDAQQKDLQDQASVLPYGRQEVTGPTRELSRLSGRFRSNYCEVRARRIYGWSCDGVAGMLKNLMSNPNSWIKNDVYQHREEN